MTGWIVATATTAALGLAGAATLGARHEQSAVWGNDVLANAEQAVRVFGGGSQIGVSIRDFNDDELKAGKVTNGVVIEDVEADGPGAEGGLQGRRRGDRLRRRARPQHAAVHSPGAGNSRRPRRWRRQSCATGSECRSPSSRGREARSSSGTARKTTRSGWRRRSCRLPIFKEDLISPKFDVFVAGAAGPLGLSVDELTPQLGEYFGAKEGVLVKTVRDNSNASRAGVKAGDVITSVNGGTVSSAVDLRRRAQRLEDGDEFTLAIVREKKPMTLKGKVEAPARRSQAKTIV